MKKLINEISERNGIEPKAAGATWVAIIAEAVAQVALLSVFDQSKHAEKAIIRQIRLHSCSIFKDYDRVGTESFEVLDSEFGTLKTVSGAAMYSDMQDSAELLFDTVADQKPHEILRSLAGIGLEIIEALRRESIYRGLKAEYEVFFNNCIRISAENKEVTQILINRIQSL